MSLARYGQILLAPWRQRDRAAPWGRRIVAALVVASGAASLVWMPPPQGGRVVAALALLTSLFAWVSVCLSLVEQNHPIAARTVPGHARTLQRSALLGWALFATLGTALISWVLTAPGLWPLLLLCSGSLTVLFLWAARAMWLWLLMSLLMGLWLLSIATSDPLTPAWQALATLWAAYPYPVLAAGLLLQAWLVRRVFARGDAVHQARYAAGMVIRRALQEPAEGGVPPSYARETFERFKGLGSSFDYTSTAWLDRLINRADNRCQRSVMARAEIVLHGQQHWLQLVAGGAMLVAFVATVLPVALAITGMRLDTLLQRYNFAIGIGISTGVAFGGLAVGATLTDELWATRREQALLRLLPGMPQGRELNLALARRQWRDFIVGWLLTTALLVALGLYMSNPLLLCLPLATLPVATWMLTRRPALLRPPTGMIMDWPRVQLLALALACSVLVENHLAPLWLLGLVLAGVSAALLAWRWPRLAAAPTALPAGRLAA